MLDPGLRARDRLQGLLAPEEEARAIRNRIRARELRAKDVELAALAGHLGARILKPELPELSSFGPAAYEAWSLLGPACGRLPAVAWALGACQAALAHGFERIATQTRWGRLVTTERELLAECQRWVRIRASGRRVPKPVVARILAAEDELHRRTLRRDPPRYFYCEVIRCLARCCTAADYTRLAWAAAEEAGAAEEGSGQRISTVDQHGLATLAWAALQPSR